MFMHTHNSQFKNFLRIRKEMRLRGGTLGRESKLQIQRMLSRTASRPRTSVGNVVIISCMVLSLYFLSSIKSGYCRLQVNTVDISYNSNQGLTPPKLDDYVESGEEDEKYITKMASFNTSTNRITNTNKPICDTSSARSDICDVIGDIRLDPRSATFFINNPSIPQQEWRIRPYARKNGVPTTSVKEWSLKTLNHELPFPECTKTYKVTTIVFSAGGFSGQLFHDFSDVIVPLFATSYHLKGEVQFLISDAKPNWIRKFGPILRKLSRYEVVNTTINREEVWCFPRVVVGLDFHKELGVDDDKLSGSSMVEFRKLLANTFYLGRTKISTFKPRLLIISRKNSRAILNLEAITKVAKNLGYEVVVSTLELTSDMRRFAKLVNSVDVMMGVYGSELTNMLFLPKGAVVVQVVPLGKLEWIARSKFRSSAFGMGLKYLDYVINRGESTLSQKYSRHHFVIRNPMVVHKKGFNEIKKVYLDKQDVKLDVGRFRGTLEKALELLKGGKKRY